MKNRNKAIVETIKKSLNNPTAVVKALEILYNNQTEDEKLSKETKHNNNVGFSGCDARIGTWLVEVVIAEGRAKGRPDSQLLRGKAFQMAHKIVSRYVSTQLLQAAKVKLEEKAEKERNAYFPPTPAEMEKICYYNNL
jgi:hypothetical protein